MIVVANAGPLIALAQIGHFNLLQSLYGQLHIPPAVRDERRAMPDWSAVIRHLEELRRYIGYLQELQRHTRDEVLHDWRVRSVGVDEEN
jgi:predicted nucleic acid-binding protein